MTIPQSGYIIQRPRHWWQNRRSGWEIPMSKRAPGKLLLVGGLEHLDYFSTYWEFHHPNWLSYFSEGLKPPTSWHEKRMQDVVPIYWGKEHNILDTIRMIRDVTGKTNQGWLGIIPKWPNFSNIIYPDVLYNHALQIVTWKCWLFEWNFGHHSCFFPVLFIYSNISVQWLMADHNGGITGTANGHDTIMLHSPLHSGNLT